MGTFVNLPLLYALMLGALALMCFFIILARYNQRAISWLGTAMLLAAIESYALSIGRGNAFEHLVVFITIPAAALCFGEAVRLTTDAGPPHFRLMGLLSGLATSSIALLALDKPYMLQTLPFQFGCSVALCEPAARLWRISGRTAVDTALSLTLTTIAAIFLSRVILFPLLFDYNASYQSIRFSDLQKILIGSASMLVLVSAFLLLARIISCQLSEYRTRAERDGLSGLYNRETFEIIARVQTRQSGCLVICDIDHFKQVNDLYGHHAGDAVIRTFAAILSDTGFLVGRIGGEEFALLLPRHLESEASAICDRMRTRIAETTFPEIPADYAITASFGLTCYVAHTSLSDAFREADNALYEAKRLGRDRLCLAPPAPQDNAFVPQLESHTIDMVGTSGMMC